MDAEIRGQKGRLFIRWTSQMEASMNDFPLLVFFAHVCALIYDTEESDHTAQYICSATANGNEWKNATKMFCLQSHQHFFVHKQFWPHFICFITIQLLDQFSPYPVYFPSTHISSNYFFIQSCVHCLSLTDFIYILEMVKWWLEGEGWANTDYCSIVGDATQLHLLITEAVNFGVIQHTIKGQIIKCINVQNYGTEIELKGQEYVVILCVL